MSFSSEVKEELAGQTGKSRHCRLAELSAIICHAGKLKAGKGNVTLGIETENSLLKEKYRHFLLLLYGIALEETEELSGEQLLKVLESVKIWDKNKGSFSDMSCVDGMLIQQSCCRRAFIRGAFLASGSISDPNKAYHLEIVCDTIAKAEQLQAVMKTFDVEAKIITRKKHEVVYVKEGAHIVDLLNVMEAHVALMNLENVRIVKEMRNSVNRQVNCETANISKTVNAAVRQIEDIIYIRDKKGLDSLPDNLREIAMLRLEYPDMALKELGTCLNPPVGKSGVNHRLRKISEIAEEMGLKRMGGESK
ncbi:MAG: DNA-binding protein WhiA [Lachnospiraceae bacterium]|nr:DNA-binding protein WhiA [Lachnospiraceae bacterium]